MEDCYFEVENSLGYIEVFPKPSDAILRKFYADLYYQDPFGSYSKSYTESELEYFRNDGKVAAHFAERFSVFHSLFDIGCGEGYFLEVFFRLGWDLTCCDFSDYGVLNHNCDLLPFFRKGPINDIIEELIIHGKKFGLINLQNVLEHVVDPVYLLKRIKNLMGAGPMIRIKVPNDYSDFQMELMKNGFCENTWFSPPEHLSYFNSENLRRVIEECGFRLISVQADFPIEVFLTNPSSNYWRDRTLGKDVHLARVFCENYLVNKNIDSYIKYSEAAGELGFGRGIIIYAEPNL